MLKFIRTLKGLNRFIKVLWITCGELGNFLFVFFLVVFIYTLLGMSCVVQKGNFLFINPLR